MNGASAPAIRCDSLSCGYHRREVLSGLSFEIAHGETVALLGPNGSGKSTLLKTLVKSLAPISGSVEIDGIGGNDISFPELARRVAFVPQEEHPYFPFTVRQVVVMGRFARSTSLRDTEEDLMAADAAMKEVDCEELADRSIIELSGGERQRVWIARALAQGAPILLLDEPTSHLDISHQLALSRLVSRLAAKGQTVLAAVHDLNLAAAMCARTILLHKGGVAMDDSTQAVLKSDALEQVYGASFERLEVGGATRVLPRLRD